MSESNEVLACTIKMNDQASSVLNRINSGFSSLIQNSERFNRTMGRIGRGSRGLEAVDQRMRQFRQSTTSANSHITNMTTRVDLLESQLSEARNRTQELTQQLDEMRRRMEDLTRNQSQFSSNIGSSCNKMQRLIGLVRNLALSYVGLQGVKKAFQLSDESINLKARLSLVNDGTRTPFELQSAIYQSALRSRGKREDIAATVSKLGILAGDKFQNNSELIAFTETLQKAFKISGASTQESSAAMYQLTQAMASGKLQGDEFRSILENAPMLAESIENYMKSTGVKGTLKDWSSDGLLTAEVIKKSLFMAADEINEKFATMPKTFGDVWNEISNTASMIFSPIFTQMNQGLSQVFNNDTLTKIANGFQTASFYMSSFVSNTKLFIQQAAPGLSSISSGFSQIGRAIFSSNGLVATFFNTMTRLSRSKGIQSFFAGLTNISVFAIRGIGGLISTIGNLAIRFSGFLPILMGVTVAFVVFQTTTNMVNATIHSVKSAMEMARQTMHAYQTVARVATEAQRGLNAAMAAAPVTSFVTALMRVVGALASVAAGIVTVNKMIGVSANMNASIGGYSDEAWKLSKEKGYSLSAAQKIVEDRKAYVNRLQEASNSFKQGIKETRQWTPAEAAATQTGSLMDDLEKFENIKNNKAVEKIKLSNRLVLDIGQVTIWQAENERNTIQQDLEYQKMMKDLESMEDNFPKDFDIGIPGGDTLDEIKGDTGKIADSIEIAAEYLELMRDLAERETVNQFTTAPIYLDARSTNHVSSEIDLDQMVTYIEGKLWNGLNTAAEGVHY